MGWLVILCSLSNMSDEFPCDGDGFPGMDFLSYLDSLRFWS